MKKRILSLVIVLCLVVGLCPMFASASGRNAFLVDADGTVRFLGESMSSDDGKSWSYDGSTETLTLNGYNGGFVFGEIKKIVLAEGSKNTLAGLYFSNPTDEDKKAYISGSGELTLKFDESLFKSNKFETEYGSLKDSDKFMVCENYIFPSSLGYYEWAGSSNPNHSVIALEDGLTLTGGVKEGDNFKLELENVEHCAGSAYFVQFPKTPSGQKASYVRIAPAGTKPSKPSDPTVGGFSDVKTGAYYAESVVWAVDNGITAGTGGNKFSPNQTCTRDQIVTFLYRSKNSPEVTVTDQFTDMPKSEEFRKAISWAVEKEITVGDGKGKFLPSKGCTRVQAVTFIWRAANRPEPKSTATFTDMPANSDFQKAISWAYENGITKGVGDGTKFGPDQTCTRGQIVTFLYNAKDL